MTGLDSNVPTAAATSPSGFNVATSIAVALVAVFTLCVLIALCYSIYYYQAKLKLQRADLDRSERSESPESPEAQVTGVDLEAAITPPSRNSTTAGPSADMPDLAISMPSADLALQSSGQELKSPITADTKVQTVILEDKALGRCEDLRPPIRHNLDGPSVEGQLFAFRSSRI